VQSFPYGTVWSRAPGGFAAEPRILRGYGRPAARPSFHRQASSGEPVVPDQGPHAMLVTGVSDV